MKKLIKICVVVGLLLVVTDFVQANPFTYAPETYHPQWVGGSTYQRDIYLDFSSQYPAGPTGPIPGAVYSGTEDSQWWDSDYVYAFGWDGEYLPSIIQQFDTFAPITSRSGFLGINYNGGAGSAGGDFLGIHLDNRWPTVGGEKHVWVEIVWSPGGMGKSILAPTGYQKTDFLGYQTAYLGDGFFRDAWGATIEPNPEYETLSIIFSPTAAPWGDSMLADLYGIDARLIDSIHIATECTAAVIPAPGAILLGGIGVVLVGWLRRRRTL